MKDHQHNFICEHCGKTPSEVDAVEAGPYRVSMAKRKFYIDNKPVHLTKKHLAIMHILVANAGSVVPIDDIVEAGWGPSTLDVPNPPLRIYISNLRKIIGDKDLNIIETFDAYGYKLNVQ